MCDYRDKCKHMDFVELRSYIDSRLADLTIRVDRASEGPTTKEDFIELCQLLEQRISEPARLSPGLAALEQQLRDLSAALHAMPDNSRSRRRSIKKLERRIDFLQKEIMPLRQREKAGMRLRETDITDDPTDPVSRSESAETSRQYSRSCVNSGNTALLAGGTARRMDA